MDEMLKWITTYGLAIVISGVVIYLAFRFGLARLHDYERRMGLIRQEKHDELDAIRTHVSPIVSGKLDKLLMRTKGDRSYAFEFHNGSVSDGGLPFLKMTCEYEELANNAGSELHRRENMSRHLLAKFVDALMRSPYLIMDVENRTDEFSDFEYAILVERKIILTVRAPLKNDRGRLIGYVGIDYGVRPDKATVREAVTAIQYAATELGALLSVSGRK